MYVHVRTLRPRCLRVQLEPHNPNVEDTSDLLLGGLSISTKRFP